jgi:hypothetical protein
MGTPVATRPATSMRPSVDALQSAEGVTGQGAPSLWSSGSGDTREAMHGAHDASAWSPDGGTPRSPMGSPSRQEPEPSRWRTAEQSWLPLMKYVHVTVGAAGYRPHRGNPYICVRIQSDALGSSARRAGGTVLPNRHTTITRSQTRPPRPGPPRHGVSPRVGVRFLAFRGIRGGQPMARRVLMACCPEGRRRPRR